jgi:hypothetical protein
MAKLYNTLPSIIMGLQSEGEYVCFCFDEACAYIRQRLDKGDEIVRRTHYSSFSQMYADLEAEED